MARTEGTVRSALGTTAIAGVAVGLAWVLGYLLQPVLNSRLTALYQNGFDTLSLLVATYLLLRVFGYILTVVEDSGTFTPHQREVIYRGVQFLTFGGISIAVIIYIWNIALPNVILGAGVTSVILALAARQILTSVFAGVTLIATDMFRVGDWVKIDQRFGKIEQISLFNTMVRSPHDEVHVFPNDDVISRDITNLGQGRYRNDVLIGVDYETDITHATTVCDSVLEALTMEDGNTIDGYHPTTVKDFSSSQIELSIKIWVNEPRPMSINRAQTVVFATIQERFADEQITIPFPQRTISERESS